jgi:amino acid adenylation domain-containing protein
VKMDFQSELLSRGHAEHIIDTLNAILSAFANNPSQDIRTVNRISNKGQDAILSFTAPELERSTECIHSAIKQQVAYCPEASAIEAWDVSFSYAKLYKISFLVAKDLLDIGLGPQTVVPLLFEKSGWTTVAMLAVMLAGGTFVLLDPSHPRYRLEEIIAQLSPTVVISSRQQKELASSFIETVFEVGPDIAERPRGPEKIAIADNLKSTDAAFIIFTSGSTGKPKGVVIEHGAFVSAAKAHSGPLEMTNSSRVLQFTSYSFDACLLETLTTLISGGTVCVPTDANRSSNLPKIMRDLEITWANLTPLVADILLKEYLPRLQTLVVAGEAMSQDQISYWANSSTHLINGYGPTEASVAATLNLDAINSVPSNIGHPVGCRVWILDSCQNLVPPGALGELFIDGPTLARGYFGDPEKTAAAFIEPPSWLETKYPHIYMTGDLVRYSLDGSMSFVGRKDTSQVKIRGQRVEVSEVEDGVRSLLPDHGQVAVVFRKFLAGRGQLIAFIVLPGQSSDDAILEMDETTRYQFCEIRQSLSLSLPRYMVPDMFIPLTRLPLKLSGKLDRAYLRQLVDGLSHYQKLLYSLAEAAAQEVAPQTGMEKTLQRLWCAVLEIGPHQIRAQSNFFKIGGDSVLAMKLTANAHNEGLFLTVSAVFQHPTLQGMAAYLDSQGSLIEIPMVNIEPFALLRGIRGSTEEICTSVALQCALSLDKIHDIYPCTPLQEGLIALSMKQPGCYVAQYVLQLPSGLDIERFKAAWEKVVATTEVFRTRIVVNGLNILQAVVAQNIHWEHSQIQESLTTSVHNMKPIQLGMPLQHFEILEGPEAYFFRLTVHHAIYDGWSLSLMFKQVEVLYDGHSPQHLTPFNRFIAHLAEVNGNSSEYWYTQFLGANIHHFPDPVHDSYTCRGHESITRKLKDVEVVGTGVTPSTILRAAWAITIARVTASNDVLFGVVLSGRNVPIAEATRIVGPTITTVPIRVKLELSQPISDFLQDLQKHATEMIPHEHAGLQAIKNYSKNEDAAAFTSVIVVQSKDTDIDSIKFMGSEIVHVMKADFDTYPLVLEYRPGVKAESILCARYDKQMISSEKMEAVLEDFQFVLRQINGKIDTKIGDLVVFETREEEHHHTSNTDTQSLKENLESIWKESRLQTPFPSCKPLDFRSSTEAEKQLQKLWSHLLGVSTTRIGLEDNFFRLGGDSIAAIKLTAAARVQNISLPVATIFNNPTLSEMAKEMETTNGNEQTVAPFALIESSETDVLESVALQCSITAGQIEDLYPCTPLQEGLMALSTKQPGAYVAQYIFRVPHSIDLEHFKKAWNSTSQLHTILRTRIILQGSLMLQVVVKEATKFENHSTVDLDGFLRENTLKTGFGAKLSRFIIVKTADGGQYFVLLLHHTTFDAWSLPTLFDSVTRFYEQRLVSKPTPYNNFIDYILNDNKESMALFWATYLKALDTSHFPQLPSPSYTPSETKTIRRSISISRPSESQITTSALLRGAWAVTLGNYSNCKDVVFCTTLSGRNTPLQGIMGITGPTIATVPIRIDVDLKQSCKDFLQVIQSQTAAMIPFEQCGLQNIRRISTDAMKACDAPSLLVIQSEAEGNKDNRLLGLDPILTPIANISSYPLAIECKIGNGRVDVFGYYDDSVISETQMHRIQHHFEHVLRQLGEESLDLLGEVSKVSSYDCNVLEKWNKEVPQVIEKCIHEITHNQAIATPDAPAVWAWDAKWSHAELDRLSSCLAYDLIQVGVKSEAIVPMCFERSGWVVVAMLGILKAGGAFLPWDPAHPEERRKEMIRQTGSEVIVTSKQTAVLCSGLAKTTFVVDPVSFDGRDVELEPHDDPHTAAYVIYTSGSTGKPKGVVIEHKAYSTSAIAHGPVHRIHSKSRVAQFASYSVDAICLEIITSIMMGGCTCICSDSQRNNGLGIALNEMGVTVAALTPSVLSLMSPEELPHLETVIMVGEPAPPALVERWGIFFHLINGYGPTETSLSAVMNEKMTAAAGSNIGHAVGCVTWIVDMYNHERLVPIGCIGELIIEGPTLARGYLHEETKTSQAFVANPGWLQRRGSKLYKTGDLVRYDPDGTIVFVGRKDMQVKINGHRIELGEIEHHIMRALHFIQQAVVETITTDDARVLVAILVIEDTQELDVQSVEACTMTPALKLHLQTLERLLISTLPTYMVPNLWIPMNEMLFASSGKVDRKRLQELATVIWNTQRTQYALSDGTKREPMGFALELRKMWSTVLNLPVEEISADDNFFHIGADSIAAMKLAGYASKQGWELSVASIFHTPILDGMAKILVPERRLLEEAPKPFSLLCNANIDALFKEIRSRLFDPECEIEDVMPSTDFQAWAVSYGSMNAGFITYMNLIPAKELDEDRLEGACRGVVASHPILRTTFVHYRNEILQVVLKNPLLHFERIKCVESIDVTWHQWFQKQQQLRLGENIVKFVFLTHKTDQRLVMRISHAQYDGISFPSIWKSLSQAYAGQDIPPSRPFSTFISAIADKTDSREYWKDMLANSKMTSISSNFSHSYNRPLDQTIERIIDLPSIHPDFTLATFIKASWSIVLSHIANESDLVFGNLVSGRSLSLDRVVGPCLNIVPVRVRLDPSCTVLELLRQIQNQQLASIPFETLGFREIVKVTDWHPSTRYSSVVQHQNIPELKEKILMDGVECEAHAYRAAIDTSDIEILSMTLDGKLKLEIGYCEEVISQPEANIWLEVLCRLVAQLSDSLDAKVENIDVAHFDVAKGRESSADSTSVPAATNNSSRKTPGSSVASIRHLNKVESKLQSLWHGVLDKGQLKNRWSDILPSTSFFSLPGADLVSACILASRFQQEGYDLTAREVIDNDTLEGQAVLIEQRGGRDRQYGYFLI